MAQWLHRGVWRSEARHPKVIGEVIGIGEFEHGAWQIAIGGGMLRHQTTHTRKDVTKVELVQWFDGPALWGREL